MRIILVFATLLTGLFLVGPVAANPLNKWEISCSVDAGSVKKRGRNWTFKTSSNQCTGGVFNQRAEISTQSIPPTRKGSYLFTANVSMRTNTTKQFSIFSIHDARDGCAPPLQVFVEPNGTLWAASDVKLGPGEACIRGSFGSARSKGRILRDGTEQELKIFVSFDGDGGFAATIWIDGVLQIQGRYRPRENVKFRSKKFYFKHGVYSKRVFDYVMVSKGVSVKRARLK
jgi:hypothetical protein